MKKDINKKSISGLVALVLAALLLINTIAIAEHTAWDCPECGRKGISSNYCGSCGHAAPWLEQEPEGSAEETETSTEEGTVETEEAESSETTDQVGKEPEPKYQNEYFTNGSLKIEYIKDLEGRVIRTNYYNRYGEIRNYSISSEWDANGFIVQETDYYPQNPGKYQERYYMSTYDDRGNCLTWESTLRDGADRFSGENTYDDRDNLLTSITRKTDGSVTKTVNTYDEKDHVISSVTMDANGQINRQQKNYIYEGDHLTEYTAYDATGSVVSVYRAIWQGDERIEYTETDAGGKVIEHYTFDSDYGDELSGYYISSGKRYEEYYNYESESYTRDWRSLDYGSRNVTKYNTKGEPLQQESYDLDEGTKTEWVYSSTTVYSVNQEGQKTRESTYADGRRYYIVEDSEGNTILSKSYNKEGKFDYASSYEYNEKGQEIRRNSLNEDDSLESYNTYEYDAKGNKIKENSYKADGSLSSYDTYEYDSKGNNTRTNSYNADGSLSTFETYEYDKWGHSTIHRYYEADGTYWFGFAYEYDESGSYIGSHEINEDGTPVEEESTGTSSGSLEGSNAGSSSKNNATTVSVSSSVNYDKGIAKLSWTVNGTAPSSYYVYAQIKNHGVSEQEINELGTTSDTYLQTDQLIPGINYEIKVCDPSGNTLGTGTIRMPDVPDFEDGKLKSTSIKISTEARKYSLFEDQKAKYVQKLSAKEIEDGLDGWTYYGVKYQMQMPQLAKERAFFVTVVFESPDGFMAVENATNITFDRVNNGYQTLFWDITGSSFFRRMKDTVGSISAGTYNIYLYWDGMFVNKTSFKVEK